ncbi:hypothetical protein H6P81_002769 [Aristolochia fimbriata]|uniref:Uncharacterized protein n=1 Tax=Aristolochia fimbriata TaxID=158543 RepID=A0AAV7FDW3_ARIFI|nr:hypothetical protein H6P81_002769 [Aristolochia fimbriata]
MKQGITTEWKRCKREMPYIHDIPQSLKYHAKVTSSDYRALIFSIDVSHLQTLRMIHEVGINSRYFDGIEALVRYVSMPDIIDVSSLVSPSLVETVDFWIFIRTLWSMSFLVD